MYVDQNFEMPPKVFDSFSKSADCPDIFEGHPALVDKVDPNPTNASRMKLLKLSIGNTCIDGRDGFEFTIHPIDSVEHARIIGAIHAGLRKDGALNTTQSTV